MPRRPPPARSAQGGVRDQQAAQATAAARRPGHRRLRNDRAGRSGDGVPLRRQGQLRSARHPAHAEGRGPGAVRGDRGQSRPEAAGFPRRRPAPLPRRAGRAVPRRGAGHLQRRETADSRGRHDVLAVLAPSPRRALPRRRRDRGDQDRARPPPRRPVGNVLPQPVLRRQAEDDAPEARLRRRPQRRHPAALLRPGARSRAIRGSHGLPDHPVHAVRLAGAPAAKAGHGDAARVGTTRSGTARLDLLGTRHGHALAPDGPAAVRLRRRARDGECGGRRRHRVRRRSRARGRDRARGARTATGGGTARRSSRSCATDGHRGRRRATSRRCPCPARTGCGAPRRWSAAWAAG